MKVLLLSPYHSGSHRAWVDGWLAHTIHEVTLMSLPGRFWKWRMQGAAVTLARQCNEGQLAPDILVADDMVDLATFLSLTRRRTAGIPAVLYMHENQLTYPLPENPRSGPMRRNWGVRERAYGLINWKSMLAADAIWFNSQFHLDTWFEALPRFLAHYPDFQEVDSIEALRKKAGVMPVGVARPGRPNPVPASEKVPMILWNQRWEFDKNPKGFFTALAAVKKRGLSFKLAVCGENFQHAPQPFLEAQQRFKQELIHFGFAEPALYASFLWAAAITVSTAHHEFFGISMVEAMMAETFPILPNRLSYPEILPASFHKLCLYDTSYELIERISWALAHPAEVRAAAESVAASMAQFEAAAVSVQFDQKLTAVTLTS